MSKKTDLLKARFLVNMGRVSGLVKLVSSDIDQLRPTGFGQYEGAGADILRSVVVFLHATFETLLRSQIVHQRKKSGVSILAQISRGHYVIPTLMPSVSSISIRH